MKISILGNGKMASMLVQKMLARQVTVELWARDIQKAKTLFAHLPISLVEDIREIGHESDMIVLALADSALAEVAIQLGKRKGLVIHTSGATSIDVLYTFDNRGVWWPPASVQMMADESIAYVALAEANSEENLAKIESFSHLLGIHYIEKCDSFKRLQMHTAAVFANNFTTYLLLRLREYCDSHAIAVDIYKPMLNQAVNSFFASHPNHLTGPASRGDKLSLKKHMEVLEGDSELKKIYQFLTDSILRFKNFDFETKDLS